MLFVGFGMAMLLLQQLLVLKIALKKSVFYVFLLLYLFFISLLSLCQAQAETDFKEITVLKDDSLAYIATAHNLTLSELLELNNLKSTKVNAGNTLIVLDKTSIQDIPTHYQDLTIASGFTLSEIAYTYNTSIKAIQTANELCGEKILIGQVLRIPLGKTTITTKSYSYQVDAAGYIRIKEGDTLNAIAKSFCVPKSLLIKNNNLQNEIVEIGQQLYVENKPIENILIENTQGVIDNDLANELIVNDEPIADESSNLMTSEENVLDTPQVPEGINPAIKTNTDIVLNTITISAKPAFQPEELTQVASVRDLPAYCTDPSFQSRSECMQ